MQLTSHIFSKQEPENEEVPVVDAGVPGTRIGTRRGKPVRPSKRAVRNNVIDIAMAMRALRPPPPQLARRTATSLGGVPVLMLSDWRWGSGLSFEATGGLNAYDRDIAQSRARRVFYGAAEVLNQDMAGHHYDAVVCALGGGFVEGSLVSGNELTQKKALDSIIAVANELADGITMLAREFPEVYVPCISRGFTERARVRDGVDMLVYETTCSLVEEKLPNVTFDISPEADLLFKVYDTSYLLTHADNPQRQVPRGEVGYDRLMLAGVGARFRSAENIIVNGSLRGIEKEPEGRFFREDMPSQALWVTHPERGVGYLQPIFGDALVTDDTELAPIARPRMR
jgi:hypothetical protein